MVEDLKGRSPIRPFNRGRATGWRARWMAVRLSLWFVRIMPIRPENRKRYPDNWPEMSAYIRFDRAGGRCECEGQCGVDHGGRCDARHGLHHPITGSIVVLTAAHWHGRKLEDTDTDCAFAACQRCHNRYDAPMRAAGRAKRKEAERQKVLRVAGQMAFEMECKTGKKVARK